MPYVPHTEHDVSEMLQAIGVGSIRELFDQQIPKDLRLERLLDIPAAMSEVELSQHMGGLASRNLSASDSVCFLGGGSYDHFVPAVVDTLSARGEFLTSYTPYQPEVSQGNLQATFEYQTLICQLTGMDVANASLYDGGSATVEAVMMCISSHRKAKRVVVPESLHPEFREVIASYLINLGVELVTLDASCGMLDVEKLAAVIDDETACVVIQHPNFFGYLEDVQSISKMCHEHGTFLVQVFDPLSLGVLHRPGDLGADVAVAEGQGLGNSLAYGGPYLGIMACRDRFMRRMPGRIAGQTTSQGDRRCWVLTLQTREQHIRREKATSNICTNQGICALRATIYLTLMGPQGMREVGELCVRKANYAHEMIASLERFSSPFSGPFFKEFVVRDRQGNVSELLRQGTEAGILAGIPLGKWYPELDDCFLVAVTEKRTKQEIDALVQSFNNTKDRVETIHA